MLGPRETAHSLAYLCWVQMSDPPGSQCQTAGDGAPSLTHACTGQTRGMASQAVLDT